MKQKLLGYEAPSTTIFVVKIETAILQASVRGMSINELYDDEDSITF